MCGIDVTIASGETAAAVVRRASAAQHQLLRRRGPDATSEHVIQGPGFAVRLVGSVLALRGDRVVTQPSLDARGNALLWNGELFGGQPYVPPGASDTEYLLAALGATPALSVPEVMQRLQGPWAFAYWHAESRTLWYGRDPLGRRSLMRADALSTPAVGDVEGASFRLSSVAPFEVSSLADGLPDTWSELPANGIGSVRVLDHGELETSWHPALPMPPPLPLDGALRNALVDNGDGASDDKAIASAPSPSP